MLITRDPNAVERRPSATPPRCHPVAQPAPSSKPCTLAASALGGSRSRHAWASMAVSALECGLLPITQTAMRFLKVAYHEYQGVVLDAAEKASLIADLGTSEALILRNHGAITVGRTVGEAFNWMHRLELACHSQLAAMATGARLHAVPQPVLEATWNNYQRGTRRPYGLMEWPALLRKLDRLDPGYKT